MDLTAFPATVVKRSGIRNIGRLDYNRPMIVRYRTYLEQKNLAPSGMSSDVLPNAPESKSLLHMPYRRTFARFCHLAGGELEQIQFLLGHVSVETIERYLGCKQNLRDAVNDQLGWMDASGC
jgi:hypothetical protein